MSDIILREGERLDDLLIDDRKIIQNPSYYMLTSDAILLARFAKVRKGEKVCDLGTGSGIIPLHMALTYEGGDYTGIEIQECMADMASRSIILNSLEDRVRVLCRDMRGYGAECRESYDVVTSNPPYRPLGAGEVTLKNTPSMIARHEVSITLSSLLDEVSALLRYGGRFYMIHRADRLAEIVYELKLRHLEPKEIVNIIRKGDTADTVMISATKGGKSGVKVSVMDLRG